MDIAISQSKKQRQDIAKTKHQKPHSTKCVSILKSLVELQMEDTDMGQISMEEGVGTKVVSQLYHLKF